MKLKEFNAETCINHRNDNQVASMHIHVKTGLISINAKAQELIGVADKEQIALYQDEDNPTNWYIEKVKTKGFHLRQAKAGSKSLFFNNTQLAKELFASVDYTGKSGKCLIAGSPTKIDKRFLYGLITGKLINS